MNVRLQKFLADAGIASRRACEQIILEGRVAVNGQPVPATEIFLGGGEGVADANPVVFTKA